MIMDNSSKRYILIHNEVCAGTHGLLSSALDLCICFVMAVSNETSVAYHDRGAGMPHEVRSMHQGEVTESGWQLSSWRRAK